jgi:hypothetical protein
MAIPTNPPKGGWYIKDLDGSIRPDPAYPDPDTGAPPVNPPVIRETYFVTSADIPFSPDIPLIRPGMSYMDATTVSGPLTLKPGPNAVRGAMVYLRLIANGSHVPNLTAFKQKVGSQAYNNGLGIENQLQFEFDGFNYFVTVGQALNAVPVQTSTKAGIISAPVITGTPTVGTPLSITAGVFSSGNPAATITRAIFAGTTQVSSANSYTPVTADIGKTFTVVDTASNSAGATPNMSADSAKCVAAAGTTPAPTTPVEAVSPYPTLRVLPAQMTTNFGSVTSGTDFDGAAILQIPNATAEIASVPELELGVTYDVFMNWTVSAVPATVSGGSAVTFVSAFTPWKADGDMTSQGTSRWIGMIPPQAPGVIERSQLPWTMTRATANDIMRIRLGRRSDNIGNSNLVQIRSFEYVPVAPPTEATIASTASITPTAGAVDLHGFSIYTPLRSSAAATYLVEPLTVGSQQQSRLMKLNKNGYTVLQDVQIGALNHDGVVGHRDGSVVVTDSGKVICYPEGHHAAWAGKIALTEDLTTLAAMTVPAGLDKHCSYRRFFRNPFDGSTWMAARGNDYHAAVWKFNESTNTFDRKPGSTMLAGDGGTFLGSYGMELAFGSENIIYATTEFYQGTTASTLSGYPRQNLAVIKSLDGGATWQTMRGKAVKTPIVQHSVDDEIAFPTNNGLHTGVYGRLAVGSDGQPILVAAWQHPSESYRSLWVAKYDASTKKWVRRRLFKATTAFDVGNPHLAYHEGKIIVSASSTDDHTSGPSSSGGGGERVPANNNMMLFVTTDNATSWRRYDITHVAGGYGGAYIDAEALRLDNKLRMRPVNEAAPATSVIWEAAVPS